MINIQGDYLLIDKPYTWTSFQVVNKLKYAIGRHFGIKKFKIGHAGTLDPLATGLLIVCVGNFTKKIETFQGFEKEYTGTFTLGATTSSFDMEQPIDKTYPLEHITQEMIHQAAKKFIGSIEQVPPTFSAVKIKGKRAYDYAREQKEVEIKPKQITIHDFEITKINLPNIDFRIVCSKGTYIRSIARDFGLALGSGAYLSTLCRTRIGDFSLTNAYSLKDIEALFSSDLHTS
jgi:tRNA pseudouridine55 synthase